MRFCTFILLLLLHCLAHAQPLQSGNAYKVAIKKDGVYKLSHDDFRKMGFNPSEINPKNIRIYGNGGGMLPQANNEFRPIGLTESAIFVEGENDEKFDKQDYVLFYAEGPHKFSLIPQKNLFYYQNNLYSNENFLFVLVGDSPGKRIELTSNIEGSFPVINSFNDYAFHELDEHNELHSGREWYGEKFGITNEHAFKFDTPGIVPGSNVTIVSDVMGQSYGNASFKVLMNNTLVAEQFLLPITSSRYALKGQDKRDTIVINESTIGASARTEQEIRYQFVKASGFSQGYLDFVLLSFERQLKLYDKQTIFSSGQSVNNIVSNFQLAAQQENFTIWDVTNPQEAKVQQYNFSSGTASFSTETSDLKKFIVFTNQTETPQLIGKVSAQNFLSLSTPNLVIVTHPLFKKEAERLAAHRQAYSQWVVQVVTTEEVYNEFSSGRQDVTAIRDFAKMLYDKNPSQLKALLLFGKCTYDYKDRFQDNMNFVPTYESRNSLHPLQTYSSDDYFGFLESDEGEWPESPAKNHTLDIGVGRLPVSSVDEAKTVVDKIIKYDTDKKTFGAWRKEIVFVADDGNSDDGFTSLHQFQSNALANNIEQLRPFVDQKKLFMGTYAKKVQPNGETVVEMTHDIQRAFEKGALIINYTGHGSEELWADERILNTQIIHGLKNKNYPFLVTATCEFGRQDDYIISSAEQCVTHPNGGAIGLVTTARPVNATTNFDLNSAFYEALFQSSEEGYLSLGDVFRITKNNSASGVSNRNFSLLADPSLTLAIPTYNVKVNSLKTKFGSDTLKALSTVILQGQVESSQGSIISNFNGTVDALLFDKETDFVTKGRNNPPFNYKEWHSVLFRGQASVVNGAFSMEFILPKNISYKIAEGKLSLYASDVDNHIDATGFAKSFKVGGTETETEDDTTPPAIRLFVGDTTFVNGGITSSQTTLVARLSDNSGINVSDYGIGNSLTAILDGKESFALNRYYIAEVDNYRKGTIEYPLRDLEPGRHSLTLKAWDVYNNPAEATIDFVVTDGQNIIIEEFGNYPNPFNNETTFFFRHNRSGDDLEAHLFIYSSAGSLLKSEQFEVAESDYHVDVLKYQNTGDKEKKLPAGLYLARLVVRSLTNGSKNEQVTKLIILN